PIPQIVAPGLRAEQQIELVGDAVGDADDDIGVHHVMYQRNMLVADALDVVLAIAIVEHGRTLQRLDRRDPRPVALLQIISRRDGAPMAPATANAPGSCLPAARQRRGSPECAKSTRRPGSNSPSKARSPFA